MCRAYHPLVCIGLIFAIDIAEVCEGCGNLLRGKPNSLSRRRRGCRRTSMMNKDFDAVA